MKKKVLIGLTAVALVALLAVGAWAWFTATVGPISNIFTAGTVEIELVDEFVEVTNWNPGDCSDKVVYVESTGTKCALVRVKLDAKWYEADGTTPALGDDENPLSTGNVVYKVWSEEVEDFVSGIGAGWLLYDGWYYYTSPLKDENLTTSLLIEKVCLDAGETGNEYQGKILKIDVTAEAVQCSNDAYQDVWELDNLPWEVQ